MAATRTSVRTRTQVSRKCDQGVSAEAGLSGVAAVATPLVDMSGLEEATGVGQSCGVGRGFWTEQTAESKTEAPTPNGHAAGSNHFHYPHSDRTGYAAPEQGLAVQFSRVSNRKIDHRNCPGTEGIADEAYFYCMHNPCNRKYKLTKNMMWHCRGCHDCSGVHIYTQAKGMRPSLGTRGPGVSGQTLVSGLCRGSDGLFHCSHDPCATRFRTIGKLLRHCVNKHQCSMAHAADTPATEITQAGALGQSECRAV